MTDLIHTVRANLAGLMADFSRGEAKGDIAESRKWVDALRKGHIFFYEIREVDIGLKDIDWSGSHVHHQEWPAQLNRFYVLPHLVTAYRETGDADLPKLARRLIEDWIDQHDYSADEPPAAGDNTLNISIRVGQSTGRGWWASAPAFADSGVFDDAFVERMIESSRGQLACLRAYIAGQGNWRISHLDCLLFCSLVVPGLEEHQRFAVRNLNETFHRQIHADGSHEEHNPSYHRWMRDVFTDYWRLSRKRPDLGLRIEPSRVVRMWDYSVASTAPDGGSIGLHDGSAWRPGPGHIDDLRRRSAVVRETGVGKQAWDCGSGPSRYFADAGQVFIRDSWERDATMIVFDATWWGGGHCHLSRNSVSLYAGSRMLLCDPGVFSYEMSDRYAPYGKSTAAHNTVNFAGMNQSESEPHVEHVHLFEDAAVVNASYEAGYWPGEYTWNWYEGKHPGLFGMHNRTLLWLGGRCALVWDVLAFDREGQRYAAHWQLPAGTHRADAAERQAWTTGPDDNVLVQLLSAGDDATLVVYEGQEVPLRGWLPKGGPWEYEPAPQLAFEAIARGRYGNLATLLLPFRGECPPRPSVDAFTDSTGLTQGFHLRWPDGGEDIATVGSGMLRQVGEAGRLTSDGCLAAVSLREGRPARVLLGGGMYVELDGAVLVDRPEAGTYREVV